MTTFQAGANGSDLLTAFLILSPIVTDVASKTAVTATYADGMKSILSGSFSLTSSGTISGGTLTGWTAYNSDGSLDFSLTGFSVNIAPALSGGNIGSLIRTQGMTYIGSANPNASDNLSGLGTDTFIAGAATELFTPEGGTNTIRGGSGTTTVQFQGSLSAYGIVNNGNDAITVTDSVITRNGIDHISGVQILKFADMSVHIDGNGELIMPTATASQAVLWSHVGDLEPLKVSDYAVNVQNNLSGLSSLVSAHQLSSITLYDSTPSLSISPTQLSLYGNVFAEISSSATLKVDASAANLTMTGAANLGTVAVFTGAAANYTVTANSDGSVTVTDTSTGRASVDHLSNFSALQFSDQTDIVAAAPGANGAVTTGNITELYSAALSREPDVAGLAFYQNYLKANPGTSLTTFAQFFLSSPEYTSAHSYAQTTAGETQFITDLYDNLLHRAPESGAIPFYLNVITGQTAHDAVGSAQYATDVALARAEVLTYVSQSPEFLSDVKVTGTANPQHWLVFG
jgi:hypothetical protein